MRINFIPINQLLTLIALCLFMVKVVVAQTPIASPSLPTAKQIAAKVDEYMAIEVKFNRFSGSILIARGGSPVVSRSYGKANYELNVPNTPQTVFHIGSITKTFTATAIMMLHERGKLNINDPICKYLENCPAAWQPVTIRHLLTHTSGIPNFTEFEDFENFSTRYYPVSEFVNVFRDKSLEFAPGEKHKYSNSGFYLLGLIIERVSEKPYADFLRDNIFAPLKMNNTGYDDGLTLIPNRANGYRWSGRAFVNAGYWDMSTLYSTGALYSTTEDLLLWDQALYTEKLLSRKSFEEMFTPFKVISSRGGGYGYGWYADKMYNRQYTAHDGAIHGFRNDLLRFPSERVTVIALSNNQNTLTGRLTGNLAAIVFGEQLRLPKQPLLDIMLESIAQKGIEFAARRYRELKLAAPKDYDFSESMLNQLGYILLYEKKVKEAIEIFKLNVGMFPQSSNAYDSLAEAYMQNGDKELAVKNYEKSLELNPKNTNAGKMLKKLREDK